MKKQLLLPISLAHIVIIIQNIKKIIIDIYNRLDISKMYHLIQLLQQKNINVKIVPKNILIDKAYIFIEISVPL